MRVVARGTALARATRLVAVAVAGILLVAMLTRGAAPVPSPEPPPMPSVQPADPREIDSPSPLPASPARDIFRYAEPARPLTPPFPLRMREGAAPSPSAEPVRLVGLVRQGGRLRAVLAVSGEVDLAGPGEQAGEVSVLSVDEDQGVRIRLPDGRELVLTLPQ